MSSDHNRQKPETKPYKVDPDIVARLRGAINSRGMNVKKFARESGMAYPSLRDYYGGLRKPGFDAIAAILRFTGVSGDWLLLGEGAMLSQERPQANVDEALMGQIAQTVALVFSHSPSTLEKTSVREGDPGGFLYSLPHQDARKSLNQIGEQTAIAASVYNRVAQIKEPYEREEAIRQEVERMYRLRTGINATRIDG